ncbi:hypothetical protein V8E55_006441, partial [Tylopilus felleus]
QSGSGHRSPSPVLETPTKLRTLLKPTAHDATICPFNIPLTNVIPPTPETAAPWTTSGASGIPSSILVGPLGSGEPSHPAAPSTPSRGRQSAEIIKILEDSYQELDVILERVTSRTSLSPQQVAESWHKSHGCVINGHNYWNMYKSYFKTYEEDERKHVGVELDKPATPSLISRCYKRFIEDQGKQWREILEVYELTEIMKSPDQTISQWAQTFQKIHRKISHILDTAAVKHGFQSALVMCGNIINEDSSLAFQHASQDASRVMLSLVITPVE